MTLEGTAAVYRGRDRSSRSSGDLETGKGIEGGEKARVLPLDLKNPKAHSKTMKQITTLVIALASGVMPLFADHHELPKPDKDGWITLFNGKDLAGWDGNPDIWRVKDGYISGHVARLQGGNTFLIYKHPFANFELEAEWILVDGKGNSGIQVRSKQSANGANKWVVSGYQADIGNGWYGKLYEEKGRGLLAGKYKNKPTIKKDNGWNKYRITANGPKLTQELNGVVAIEFDDKDAKKAAKEGIIGLQYHSPGGFEVRFRNIRIKPLK